MLQHQPRVLRDLVQRLLEGRRVPAAESLGGAVPHVQLRSGWTNTRRHRCWLGARWIAKWATRSSVVIVLSRSPICSSGRYWPFSSATIRSRSRWSSSYVAVGPRPWAEAIIPWAM